MDATPTSQPDVDSGDSDLSSTYVLVVVVEAIVIAVLFWLGRHFG